MTIVIEYVVQAGATFDGVTDVSASVLPARYVASGDTTRYTLTLPNGSDIGRINPVNAVESIRFDAGDPVRRAGAQQRGFGIIADDYLLTQATIEYAAAPVGTPTLNKLGQADGDQLEAFQVDAAISTSTFLNACNKVLPNPNLILTGQTLQIQDAGGEPAGFRRLTLFLAPITEPGSIAELCGGGTGGGGGGGGLSNVIDEAIVTENTGAADVDLADTLNSQPITASAVILFFNGLRQRQGMDYSLVGGTNQTIRWLAGSGTAVPMLTTDSIDVTYFT